MAINKLIHLLDEFQIPATIELEGGKWCHSEEYIALRVGGLQRLRERLLQKAAAGSERARIQLALVAEKSLDWVDKQIANAVAEA